MENLNKIASDIAIKGIKNSFGIPGGGYSLNLIDEFEKNNIDFHLTKFEGAASIMAATTGFLEDKQGVSISIKGPGLVNSLTGIAFAHFESYPLVHFTEAYNQNTPESFAHKRINQNILVESIVKKNVYCNSRDVFKVIDCACEEEPGPVLIQLADENSVDSNTSLNGIKEIITLSSELLQLDVKILDDVKKPIIIVGSIAIRNNLIKKLSNLNIPIFTTVAAKGCIDESYDYSAGIFTGVGLSLTPEYTLLNESDFIICIGLNAKEVLSVKPFNCKAINFELESTSGVNGFDFYNRYHFKEFEMIIDRLEAYDWGRTQISSIKEKLFEVSSKYFLPGQIFQLLNEKYLNDSRVIIDTGNFCTIAEHIIQSKYYKSILMSSNSRFMGTSLPMGIASSIYDSSIKTIVFTGDGGVGMFLAEIDLAVKLKLPLIVVLLSDGSFASIRSRSMINSLTDRPLIMHRKSWVKIFEGFRIPSISVETLTQFDNALSNAYQSIGPVFIEVKFNLNHYLGMTNDIR